MASIIQKAWKAITDTVDVASIVQKARKRISKALDYVWGTVENVVRLSVAL